MKSGRARPPTERTTGCLLRLFDYNPSHKWWAHLHVRPIDSYCLSGAIRRQKCAKADKRMKERLLWRACRLGSQRLSAKVLQQHDVALFMIELMVQNEFAIG